MQQREKVTFEPNVPVQITLEYDDGKIVEGRFGDQYQYFLHGDRILFADPPLRDKIKASGARAGDSLAIVKRAMRSGNKRAVRWEVERKDTWEDGRYEASDEDLPSQIANAGTPRQDPPAQRGYTQQIGREFAYRDQPAQNRPAPVEAQQAHPPQQTHIADVAAADYTAALRAAIEAARAAEAYAHAHGYPLRFASAEIQAMAATIFIRTKGDR